MSSMFKNIKELNKDGQDLEVSLINVGIFGNTKTPYVVSLQVGNSRAMISLEEFCEMCQFYLVRGGLGKWESNGGIPEPVCRVLELAAKRIGR